MSLPPNAGSVGDCDGPYSVSVTDLEAGYETPEEVALADCPPSSGAHIVSVDIRGDRAQVLLDFDPSYEYWVYCVCVEGRWHEAVSGNAPTPAWDDPNEIDWS